MGVIAGVGASITANANSVGNVDDWTLNIKGENVDTTPFGSNGAWHLRTPTLKDWDVKLKGRYDANDTAQANIIGLLNTSMTVTMFTGSSTHNWSGTAILNQITPQATASGVVVIEYDFTGSGPCTYS